MTALWSCSSFETAKGLGRGENRLMIGDDRQAGLMIGDRRQPLFVFKLECIELKWETDSLCTN